MGKNSDLVLFFQNFRWMVLFVRDVDALEAMDVLWQASLVNVGLAGLDGLHQGVVYEGVLFLGLHEVIPLAPYVLQEAEHVDVPSGLNLPQHGIDHHIAASPTHAGTEDTSNRNFGSVFA